MTKAEHFGFNKPRLQCFTRGDMLLRAVQFVTLILFLFGSMSAANAQTAAEKILAARFAAQVELAEEGNLDAQMSVAQSYEHGSGVEKSIKDAIYWYEAAVEQSDLSAMWRLGSLLLDSYEPDDSSPEAKAAATQSSELYHRAARSGFVAAQQSLGLLYGFGGRVEVDRVRGRMWLFIAEENGQPMTSWLVDKLEKKMSVDERATAHKRARNCIDSGYEDCE